MTRTGRPAQDMTGAHFGRLTLVERVTSPTGKQAGYWRAQCTCGGFTVACASDFKRGRINSCGCLRKEASAERARTHGESGSNRTKEYQVWASMKQRCEDQHHKDYPKYGGRGIQVLDDFQSYEGFLRAMGRCPKGLTLERRNNMGHYTASNCVWDTPLAQGNNKRNNKLLALGGETKTMAQWARDPRCQVSYSLLKTRLGRQGWTDLLRAMTRPSLKGMR